MGGNIPGGNFVVGNYMGGNFPGGSLIGGNFPGGNFPRTDLEILHVFLSIRNKVIQFNSVQYKGPVTRNNIMKNLWRISQNFLHTCHSSSILLCISSKNMWRTCEGYVTVSCLKFYIVLNKFKSVWIYLKLWKILNNRMMLKPIEIWDLNRFKETYKHEKIKNQYMRTVDEKK